MKLCKLIEEFFVNDVVEPAIAAVSLYSDPIKHLTKKPRSSPPPPPPSSPPPGGRKKIEDEEIELYKKAA